MSKEPSDYYNSLPYEERAKIAPALNQTRLFTLKAAREMEVRRHKAALKEIDAWIANVEKGYTP